MLIGGIFLINHILFVRNITNNENIFNIIQLITSIMLLFLIIIWISAKNSITLFYDLKYNTTLQIKSLICIIWLFLDIYFNQFSLITSITFFITYSLIIFIALTISSQFKLPHYIYILNVFIVLLLFIGTYLLIFYINPDQKYIDNDIILVDIKFESNSTYTSTLYDIYQDSYFLVLLVCYDTLLYLLKYRKYKYVFFGKIIRKYNDNTMVAEGLNKHILLEYIKE